MHPVALYNYYVLNLLSEIAVKCPKTKFMLKTSLHQWFVATFVNTNGIIINTKPDYCEEDTEVIKFASKLSSELNCYEKITRPLDRICISLTTKVNK